MTDKEQQPQDQQKLIEALKWYSENCNCHFYNLAAKTLAGYGEQDE